MPEIALEPRPVDSPGPYRITRVIGRGRMGIAFEGTADAQEPPPDLTSVRPDISAAGARAVTRVLEKEPEERPHSASDYVAGVARASGV